MLDGGSTGSSIDCSPQGHETLESFGQLLLLTITFQLIIESVFEEARFFDISKSFSLE